VGQFDRQRLLVLIAEVAAAHLAVEQAASAPGLTPHNTGLIQPFALAGIARDSILDGSDLTTKIPHQADLERLCDRYLNLEDPVFRPGTRFSSMASYSVRMAYEQFPYQLSPHNELSRSWALFADTAALVGAPTMTDQAWRSALGCSLDEYIRIAFAWHAMAARHAGWVDPSVASQPEIASFLGSMTADQALEVTTSRLSADIRHLGTDPGIIKVPKGLEKYRYNPLSGRPYVRIAGRVLAPSPHLAVQRAWPNGLYYDRVKDPGFTDDLGNVFEHYVGRQLGSLETAGIAQLLPKVVFSRGRGVEESVDWFVIFPEVVLLVEAKATRLAAEARIGLDRLGIDVKRTLGVAYEQINSTAQLVRSGKPEFIHIPTDRPMLGLAVTLEPYWLIWGGDQLPTQPDGCPAHPVSCNEIEGLVSAALAGPVGDALLGLLEPADHGSRRFNGAFSGKPKVGNPILDTAFERILP
jgi:hypothetical protein